MEDYSITNSLYLEDLFLKKILGVTTFVQQNDGFYLYYDNYFVQKKDVANVLGLAHKITCLAPYSIHVGEPIHQLILNNHY